MYTLYTEWTLCTGCKRKFIPGTRYLLYVLNELYVQDVEGSVYRGLDQLLQYSALLDMTDAKCNANTFDLFVKSFPSELGTLIKNVLISYSCFFILNDFFWMVSLLCLKTCQKNAFNMEYLDFLFYFII